MEINWGRPLPPELLAEMHKCLPLANAINVLVNVSKTFVINNGPRMLRNVQQLRTSLNEYIHTFIIIEGPGRLVSNDNVEWTPKLDTLLRYGTWLTSARQLRIGGGSIVGIPGNFMEELLLHLANSSLTQMMLRSVFLKFEVETIPIPSFLKQLLNKKKQSQFGGRTLFESIELKTDNGQILHIFDGELRQYYNGNYQLILCVKNKMDWKNWFQIKVIVDHSKKFIRRLQYSCWEMQPYHENGQFEFNWLKDYLKDYQMEENGNKLEAMQNIWWNYKWDLFLRRGTAFTQFRNFKIIKIGHTLLQTQYNDYVDFLINYIYNAKHPEQFLESFDINLLYYPIHCSPFIDEIRKICRNGIPKGGKFINVGTKKLHFLSSKTVKPEMKWWERFFGGPTPTISEMQFTLANIPTNGKYLFDVNVQLDIGRWLNQIVIVGIKIQKRKIDDIVGLKCNDQIDREEKMNGNGRTALIKMILTGIGIASILILTPRFAYF